MTTIKLNSTELLTNRINNITSQERGYGGGFIITAFDAEQDPIGRFKTNSSALHYDIQNYNGEDSDLSYYETFLELRESVACSIQESCSLMFAELETLQELEVSQPLTTEQNERIEELYFILAI